MCDVIKHDILTENDEKSTVDRRKWRVAKFNVIFFVLMHIASVYGSYLLFTKAKWQTVLFAYFLYVMCTISVTGGVHRLWSHKAYKAKLPMKMILLVFYTMSYQGSVFQWVRDHRLHHKYCDTDADPHNSTRGFFFSHIGWLLLKKHPEVLAKGREIELNDIHADKLLTFQKKYYFLLVFLLCYVTPTYIPVLWNENKWIAFFTAGILRHIITLHATFFINSAAHMWGTRPYDKRILPVETKFVSVVACGEGFHNYHHTFPWDYKAAELGGYKFNMSRLFIDIMARIGWAYDLKTVSEEIIKSRTKRTGDGTHPVWQGNEEDIHKETKKSY